jgi:hypothetical protein
LRSNGQLDRFTKAGKAHSNLEVTAFIWLSSLGMEICCEVPVLKQADVRKLKTVSEGEINETHSRMQFITATE